ncbi:TPA: hypothetical protein ROX88_004094 [Bacillus pseudomycoides]|nr:hypothetical protein [Bacillus pseudomycoides]
MKAVIIGATINCVSTSGKSFACTKGIISQFITRKATFFIIEGCFLFEMSYPAFAFSLYILYNSKK